LNSLEKFDFLHRNSLSKINQHSPGHLYYVDVFRSAITKTEWQCAKEKLQVMFVCWALEKTLQARMPHSHTFKMPREQENFHSAPVFRWDVLLFCCHIFITLQVWNKHTCVHIAWFLEAEGTSCRPEYLLTIIFLFFFYATQQLYFARTNFNVSWWLNSWSPFTLHRWKLVWVKLLPGLCFA